MNPIRKAIFQGIVMAVGFILAIVAIVIGIQLGNWTYVALNLISAIALLVINL